MSFPVDEKYILETESELKVIFPSKFKKRMIQLNGGELVTTKYEFELYPFFDKISLERNNSFWQRVKALFNL